MGFGEKFFKSVKAGLTPEGRAYGRLHEQHKEARGIIPLELKRYTDKMSEILDANKKELFSLIVELDEKGENELALSTIKEPWSHALYDACSDILVDAENKEEGERSTATTIERCLAKATGTKEKMVYASPSWMRINWIQGAEGAREIAQGTLH